MRKLVLMTVLMLLAASYTFAENVKFSWDAAYKYEVFVAYDNEPFDYTAPVYIGPDLETGAIDVQENRLVRVTARTVLGENESIDSKVYVFTQHVIDDGDGGTSAVGDWTVSDATDAYGGQSLYTRATDASYVFTTDIVGTCELDLRWTAYSSRSPAVPIEIYDGESLLDTVSVNQQENGVKWNSLDTYTFDDYAKVVVSTAGNVPSSGGSYTTCVDALRIACERQSFVIIDNGDQYTSYTGEWKTSSGVDFYGTESEYSNNVGATYTFTPPSVNGSYEIALWWTYHSSRAPAVPVSIYDGDTLLDTVYLNQQENSNQWNTIGTYTFTSQPKIVITAVSSGTSTCADAVKFSAK